MLDVDDYKQKLEDFNWRVGGTLETDEWKLTINSVDEIVIESNIPCGRNYAELYTKFDQTHDCIVYRERPIVNYPPKDNEEEPSAICSALKPQEKSTQTESSNDMLTNELNPIEVTTIEKGKKSKKYISLPNHQTLCVEYVRKTVSIKQKDILNNLKQLYGTQSC